MRVKGVFLKILPAGNLAVNVFMVISGFVIAHLLMQGRETYWQYILRRGWRLLPLMLAMIALAIAIRPLYENAYVLNPFLSEHDMRANRFQAEKTYWPWHILAHVTMLHGAIPENVLKYASTTYLAPAWSISLEWQFYIFAPVFLSMLTIKSRASIATMMVAFVICAVTATGKLGTWSQDSFLPLMLTFFLIGMTFRLIFQSLRYGVSLPYQALLITGLSVALYIACNLHNLSLVVMQFGVIILAASTFFVIAAVEVGALHIKYNWFDKFSWILALNPIIVAIGRV